MAVIDFHTHIFPDDLAERALSKLKELSPDAVNHTDGTSGGLHESMVKNGLTVLYCFHSDKTAQVHVINQAAVLLQSDSFIPFGTLHPDMDFIEKEITYLKIGGIKGLNFILNTRTFILPIKNITTFMNNLPLRILSYNFMPEKIRTIQL
jgi:hypothetical protein